MIDHFISVIFSLRMEQARVLLFAALMIYTPCSMVGLFIYKC